MNATLADSLLQCLSPLRLAGPILDKELRVASRRRRLYLLRFAYVALLAAFVLRLWYVAPRAAFAGGAVVHVSRLAEMGKQIVLVVVWLQFITGQLLAAVLLSDAIGGEIRQRTLDSLLVTPVRSAQIVIGKLLSKLLEAASLLAISLPILAVVRVFGGVPWGFIVASLCITASAAIFSGSLSLASSTSNRHQYDGVLWVTLWYFVVWALLPIVLTALFGARHMGSAGVLSLLSLTNPLVVMAGLTQGMGGGAGGIYASSSWLWHCFVLLALSAVVLAWSTRRVRRAARSTTPVRIHGEEQETAGRPRRWGERRAIRPVTGSPIIWKERCTPLFKGTRRSVSVAAALFAALILVVLFVLVVLHGPTYVVLFPLVQALQLILVIDLAAGAAGAVTKEREARTWPILLMTPLDDAEIVRGKMIGVFRRNVPLLLAVLILYPMMLYVGSMNMKTPLQWVQGTILLPVHLGSMSVFLLGSGLYFSTRLRTTTVAVVSTLAAYYLPKFLFCGFLSPMFTMSTGMAAVMVGRGGGSTASWVMWVAVAPAVVYIGMGLLFMRLAVRRVRRDIF
jgi:ABC-type transport system involved in multi-copper enzyme maturation permease subunit